MDMSGLNGGQQVLVLGSAPDVVAARDWPKERVSAIVAINNAWRIRDDWDYLIVPDDFPDDRLPPRISADQKLVRSSEYVPANNDFGGVFYAGGTMAFTAGYWALSRLKPSVLAFMGCDMIYPRAGKTHFYGEGTADPLRCDLSLRSLEAKAARLMLHAAREGCACVRLSSGDSRLVFPSAHVQDLAMVSAPAPTVSGAFFDVAKAREAQLAYHIESGRYWEIADRFSGVEVEALDQLWLQAGSAADGMEPKPRLALGAS